MVWPYDTDKDTEIHKNKSVMKSCAYEFLYFVLKLSQGFGLDPWDIWTENIFLTYDFIYSVPSILKLHFTSFLLLLKKNSKSFLTLIRPKNKNTHTCNMLSPLANLRRQVESQCIVGIEPTLTRTIPASFKSSTKDLETTTT